MNWVSRSLLAVFFFIISASLAGAAQDSFSFAVFSDPHNNDAVFIPLLKSIEADPGLSFAVNCGDLVDKNSDADYQHYLKTIANFKIKIYNVPGNHDLVNGGTKRFLKNIGQLYYSFDYGNSHFIVLNNAFGECFDRPQFNWLKKDLAHNHQCHTFVFLHRPTFDPSAIYDNYVMSGREITKELMALFEKYKVDYVFSGHLHGYAKEIKSNVIYIVTAGAGAPLYLPRDFGGFYHYVKISVTDDKVSDRVIRLYD